MIGEIKFYSISNEYILCGYKIENTNVLPDDIVEYQINNGAIDITKLIYRHQLITIAIIIAFQKRASVAIILLLAILTNDNKGEDQQGYNKEYCESDNNSHVIFLPSLVTVTA